MGRKTPENPGGKEIIGWKCLEKPGRYVGVNEPEAGKHWNSWEGRQICTIMRQENPGKPRKAGWLQQITDGKTLEIPGRQAGL